MPVTAKGSVVTHSLTVLGGAGSRERYVTNDTAWVPVSTGLREGTQLPSLSYLVCVCVCVPAEERVGEAGVCD